MAGPIGRTGAAGAVGPVRDGERDGVRENGRSSSRARDAARGGADASDQVTISPDALRGLRGGFGDDAGAAGGEGTGDGDSAASGASGFRNSGEALLVARGLSNALRDDALRAVQVHDLVSPARAIALLRG